MTRFDAPEYVHAWKTRGAYPRIHDNITTVVREELDPTDPGVLLDLGSSTGLLARRLTDAGYLVCAVQEPGRALDHGRKAGVYDGVPVLELRITPVTLPRLLDWVREQHVYAVVARRVFPELYDALGPNSFRDLAVGLRDAGARWIILEGRAPTTRATHPLNCAAREVDALAPAWTLARRQGAVAVLEASWD
ncbi:hypothetical protein LI90_4341 (plasmid) [Carbonactinospora thermoautotrophica]|uniref:Methyltransferase type 11 n=1 Tax=Carbonactinospora thermoautotrophica TaxID=1469144 RepID=A0A132MHW7_9ACTN|nr:hypothetical protein [Carbonactinospora thermoautotrophica]KWW97369.1 hypothetical protein LI90_4341 [Carbonactinospora thermoautotrophica]